MCDQVLTPLKLHNKTMCSSCDNSIVGIKLNGGMRNVEYKGLNSLNSTSANTSPFSRSIDLRVYIVSREKVASWRLVIGSLGLSSIDEALLLPNKARGIQPKILPTHGAKRIVLDRE